MAGSAAALGDVTVDRIFVRNQATFPAAQISDSDIAPASNVAASKLEHQHRAHYTTGSTTAAADATQVVHVCRAAGTLVEFVAGCVDACIGDSTITVDLHKNGVSVLDADITLDSGDADRAIVAGTLDTPIVDLVAGDVLEVVIDATVGTGTLGKGVFAALTVNEEAVT